MYAINKYVLDFINQYKIKLENYINEVIIFINKSNPTINLFFTPEYKLFSIIAENVRMDLNYLLSLYIDYDVLGFPAIKRNIRVSIEAYYDLYNLISDKDYYELLKFCSNKIDNIQPQIYDKYKKYITMNKNKRYLLISNKAYIAKEINSIDKNDFEDFKKLCIDANAYIHPDVISSCCEVNKEELLKSLIGCDCKLLMRAYTSLIKYINCFTPYISQIDPETEYKNLLYAISKYAWIVYV